MGVGVEEEEENHAERHEIHVDEKENTAMVEAPAALHATDGVGGACDGGERGEDEEQRGAVAREAGDEDRRAETYQDKETAA